MNTFAVKWAAIAFLLFVALFVAGLARTFTLDEADLPKYSLAISSGPSDRISSVATANNLREIGLKETSLPQVLDQEAVNEIRVYEKTARLWSGSTAFTEDEQKARKAVAAHKAVVFSEQATGIVPARRLSLGISVHTDRFEAVLADLREVGELSDIQVEQQDRTGEFRKLHGQRQALKKHQEAILKLRQTEKLTVEEALKLEEKSLEIEKALQSIGVQLGDLLSKEPAYNLFLILQEFQPG